MLSRRCAPRLHGEHLTQAQVGATWRSVFGRDGPESAPDRSLSAPASEQVNRVSDDFARALFGYVCLGDPQMAEWGCIPLDELAEVFQPPLIIV